MGELFQRLRAGNWRDVDEVAYTDGAVTVVHAKHRQSQGTPLSNSLSGDLHERGLLGGMARAGVQFALAA